MGCGAGKESQVKTVTSVVPGADGGQDGDSKPAASKSEASHGLGSVVASDQEDNKPVSTKSEGNPNVPEHLAAERTVSPRPAAEAGAEVLSVPSAPAELNPEFEVELRSLVSDWCKQGLSLALSEGAAKISRRPSSAFAQPFLWSFAEAGRPLVAPMPDDGFAEDPVSESGSVKV
mmetsp:Transcript_94603/g.216416  ORF Transcript_94603/g.216416 Transcript_94603/m.216416 type:complete len:175 (+) Transcript_94603:41-565(+)